MSEEITINVSKIPHHRIEVNLHPTSVEKDKWHEYHTAAPKTTYFILLDESKEIDLDAP